VDMFLGKHRAGSCAASRYAKAEGLFTRWAMGKFGRNLGAKSPFFLPQ
jgi:hypothetical protein